MSMDKRRRRKESLLPMPEWPPNSASHLALKQLNRLLAGAGFDRWIERQGQYRHTSKSGRLQLSIPPGVCLRKLQIDFLEGIVRPRGIAARYAGGLSLRQFLGISPDERTPVPRTFSSARRRRPHETISRAVCDVKRPSQSANGFPLPLGRANRMSTFHDESRLSLQLL
jgi:hypothetical protein